MIESKSANSMPKRKRAHHGREEVDPTQEIELKKGELEKKLVHGRKVLNRALKTARGFERQKLGKRIKLATNSQDEAEARRLQRELDVLKVRILNLQGNGIMLIVVAVRLSTSQSLLNHTFTRPFSNRRAYMNRSCCQDTSEET